MTSARLCLNAIDAAHIIRERNPVLFARVARFRGATCRDLQIAFLRLQDNAGGSGNHYVPAHLGGFSASPATRRAAAARRAKRKSVRKGRS